MFRFHVVQAEQGDALLLEYGTAAAPRFTLIDGGPPDTYERHLRGVLAGLGAAALDVAVLSHVDNDHVIGMLDYFAELQAAPAGLPRPAALWHNGFDDTIDPDHTIQARLAGLLTATRAAAMPAAALALNGVGEGRSLRVRATAAGIPVNPDIPTGLVAVDTVTAPIRFGNLTLQVVGPTEANLAALRDAWRTWLDAHEDDLQGDDVDILANSDRSVPNLSSIMLLAVADGRSLLLTGDGRSDHLLDGLEQAGLLDPDGRLHVDVLKLAHHGSDRNVTRTFFRRVTADTYVASANGRDGNPDIETLRWIVGEAADAGREIEIVVTNRTPSVETILAESPPGDSGYTLTALPAGGHRHIIELSA